MQEFWYNGFIFLGTGFGNLYFFGISNLTFCLLVGNFQIESNKNAVKTKVNFRIWAFQCIWAIFRTPPDRRDRFMLDAISNLLFSDLEPQIYLMNRSLQPCTLETRNVKRNQFTTLLVTDSHIERKAVILSGSERHKCSTRFVLVSTSRTNTRKSFVLTFMKANFKIWSFVFYTLLFG